MQNGIDAARIAGTGRNGRVTREDVDRAVASATVVSVGQPATAQPRHFSAQDIPHDRMRLTIAENMVRAVSEAPHVTALFEADFSAVTAHKAALAARGEKLSYTAYIVKAAAEAMAVAPAINGRWEKDRIAISSTIDVGVGTALGEKGLVVPVVKNAGSLTLEQIGASLDDLTRRAREGKLTPGDVSGGSFTISNHGVSGSLLAAPIILHAGQAAILGIGKLQKRVVVRDVDGDDAMVILPMAYVDSDDRSPRGGRAPDQRLADPVRRPARTLARRLDFKHGVRSAEQRLQDELGNVVDRDPARGAALIFAVVRMTVDDRLHMIEAIDRVRQASRAEILIDRGWLALQRFDRR